MILGDGHTSNVRDQAGNTAQATFIVSDGALSQIEFTDGTDAIVSDGEVAPHAGAWIETLGLTKTALERMVASQREITNAIADNWQTA